MLDIQNTIEAESLGLKDVLNADETGRSAGCH
jgi:hypothetical protein